MGCTLKFWIQRKVGKKDNFYFTFFNYIQSILFKENYSNTQVSYYIEKRAKINIWSCITPWNAIYFTCLFIYLHYYAKHIEVLNAQ